MKINSPQSIAAAEEVFRNYAGSWTAAREAAYRDADGVLVIPKHPREAPTARDEAPLVEGRRKIG